MSLSVSSINAFGQYSDLAFKSNNTAENLNVPSVIFTNPNENNVKRVEKRDLSYGGKRIITDYGDIGLGKSYVTKTEMKDIDTKGFVRQVSSTIIDRTNGAVINESFQYDENGQLEKEFKVEPISLGVVKTTLTEYLDSGRRKVSIKRFSYGKMIGIPEETVEKLNDDGTWQSVVKTLNIRK